MKTAKEFEQHLIDLRACEPAIEWAKGKTAKEAWEQCERGDWLLWWAKREYVNTRQLTLAKVRCAKLINHLMKDERSIMALEMAEKFGLGLMGIDILIDATVAAGNAYQEALTNDFNASYVESDAAFTAYNAVDEYAPAGAVVYTAANTAYTERYEIFKKSADIVRSTITPDFL